MQNYKFISFVQKMRSIMSRKCFKRLYDLSKNMFFNSDRLNKLEDYH